MFHVHKINEIKDMKILPIWKPSQPKSSALAKKDRKEHAFTILQKACSFNKSHTQELYFQLNFTGNQ